MSTRRRTREVSPQAQETLAKVRELVSIHNTRPTPEPKPEPPGREILPVEKMGWKSNDTVLRLLKETQLDVSNLYRCNGGTGNWVFRKKHNGKLHTLNTKTTNLEQAVRIRDAELARLNQLHP